MGHIGLLHLTAKLAPSDIVGSNLKHALWQTYPCMEELIELLRTLPCYEYIGLQGRCGGCKGIELKGTDDGGTVITGMVITVQEAVDIGTVVQQVHINVSPALGIIYHEGVPEHLTPTATCGEQAENCEDEYGSCHALTP